MNHHALVNNSSNPYLFMIVCQKVVMIVLSYYTIIIGFKRFVLCGVSQKWLMLDWNPCLCCPHGIQCGSFICRRQDLPEDILASELRTVSPCCGLWHPKITLEHIHRQAFRDEWMGDTVILFQPPSFFWKVLIGTVWANSRTPVTNLLKKHGHEDHNVGPPPSRKQLVLATWVGAARLVNPPQLLWAAIIT